MDASLIAAAALMGLAGSPHCAAMCGAPCAAVVGRGHGAMGAAGGFHLGRTVGYAAAGAVVASSVEALGALGQAAPMLRPLWTLLHVAAFALGVWLLATGRQPRWLEGRAPLPAVAAPGGWQRMAAPLRAGGAGLLWVGWPCGLLQSAMLVAALAGGAAGGAMAMAAFATASSIGLWAAPALWRRFGAAGQGRLAARIAGALLAGASGWALGHGLWERVAAYCVQ